MGQKTIGTLIINSPYEVPSLHWKYDPNLKEFELTKGRRQAGYVIASGASKAYDDPGIFVEIPLVNMIRPRVDKWREQGYPGITSITKRLLEYWRDEDEKATRQFFFCQLEAIETLIWLTEAPQADRQGIEVPGDGSAFERQCCKMATGSGKTIVMAMLIAWQILNKVAYPQDTRFAKHVLVVTPGLTVKERLSVLDLTNSENYYESFRIVPGPMLDKLRQGKVIIRNWHVLAWDSAEQIKKKRKVDKRGPKSDEAYTRQVLQDMANARSLLVINDEAHHAWRFNPEAEAKYTRQRDLKDSAEEATIWVGGLDRLHRARGILRCYDFSATPFTPSGSQSSAEALFGWIVSDFGLNDAIESGLVKTPRVVVRDDAIPDVSTFKSRLYHIFNDDTVKDDLNRKAPPEEPLPDLVLNAFDLLGFDWNEAFNLWKKTGQLTPPVMITVCNRTETAARVKYAFDKHQVHVSELCIPEGILHIDSKVLKEAEEREEASGDSEIVDAETEEGVASATLSKAERAELLRKTVNTVGRVGQPGEQIRLVISVGMLSEGWDTKTVTHILGLRAFSSQLLCEQVVGRGLRRTSYEVNPTTHKFDPEYVNIFGIPFTFLPHEGTGDIAPLPPEPKYPIEPDPQKKQFEIRWPNVIRVERIFSPVLKFDLETLKPLTLDASRVIQVAELSPIVDGKPDISKISRIELEKLAEQYRYQRLAFEAARTVLDKMKKEWKGSPESLLAQLVRFIDVFIRSDKVYIIPPLFYQDELSRRLIITFNLNQIAQHIWSAISYSSTEKFMPVFDSDRPIGATGDMRTWYTGKPRLFTRKSHINFAVLDSTWESTDSFILDESDLVSAWVKNDHLGFDITYMFKGVIHKYRPDFLVKLENGDMLIVETKGQMTDEDKAKLFYLDEWISAVNSHGGFGYWSRAITRGQGELKDALIVAGRRQPLVS